MLENHRRGADLLFFIRSADEALQHLRDRGLPPRHGHARVRRGEQIKGKGPL